MKTVSVKQMRELDRKTICEAEIEGKILMERAGAGAAEFIAAFSESLDSSHSRRYVILAGKGNNGGDAYVVARHLLEKTNRKVAIFAVCAPEELSGDTRWHAQRTPGEIPREIRKKLHREDFKPGDIIIDGLLGTGVSGTLREPYSQWIKLVNSLDLPVISLDLPSGLNADDGSFSTAIRADMTVTMGLPKRGFILGRAPEILGILKCVDIGIPEKFVEEVESGFEMIFEQDIRKFLGRIPPLSHKKSRGTVCVIGGSSLFPGAPLLAACAALRSGSGLVTVAVPDKIEFNNPEMLALITRKIPGDSKGFFSEKSISCIIPLIGDADSAIIGPGLGNGSELPVFLGKILRMSKRTVFDADALNIFAKFAGKTKIPPNSVLTPHHGEMKRLLSGFGLGSLTDSDRLTQASALASKLKTVVVLKGHQTVIASPERVCVNSSGTPGLASAGTGDVLAGIIATFLAQDLEPFDAAVAGVFIHGLAAELSPSGHRGLIADELISLLPAAMRRISPFA